MSQVYSESQPQPDRPWFRFSLKTLLILIALVAVYFGGRASMRPHWFAPPPGTWQMNMPAGHQRAVTLTELPDGLFLLSTGGILGGTYRWMNGQLQVVTPADSRFMGLTWQWSGDELVLVGEPPGTPAGPSYLGTRLRFVSADTSMTAQNSVPVVPSRIPLQKQQPQRQEWNPRQEPRGLPARSVQPLLPSEAEPWREPALGDWQLTLPAGFQRTVQLKKLPNGNFELVTGIVLGGTYEARSERLVVVKPQDPRMMGLAWVWQGDELVLVDEPTPPPTGSSYVGARLRSGGDRRDQMMQAAEAEDAAVESGP